MLMITDQLVPGTEAAFIGAERSYGVFALVALCLDEAMLG